MARGSARAHSSKAPERKVEGGWRVTKRWGRMWLCDHVVKIAPSSAVTSRPGTGWVAMGRSWSSFRLYASYFARQTLRVRPREAADRAGDRVRQPELPLPGRVELGPALVQLRLSCVCLRRDLTWSEVALCTEVR